MLNKRANILFDDETWDYLAFMAEKSETSVGDLVRKAVTAIYLHPKVQKKAQRAKVVASIRKIRSKIDYQFSNYQLKELIDDGRRR